jgi:hypothetical protein
MKLPRCPSCGLPVVELEGQFAKLDSLYIHDGFPAPETSGWWHAACLAVSKVGPAWYEARLRNFCDVRRYQSVAEYPHWTVVREPNRGKLLALGRQGELLNLSRGSRKSARAVEGGRVYPKLEETFHLELDDTDLVRTIQEGLLSTGRYPLVAVLKAMGIADRTVHPEAIEQGVFLFDKELQHDWDKRFVSARAEYGVFMPAELEDHVGEFVR